MSIQNLKLMHAIAICPWNKLWFWERSWILEWSY